VNCRRSSSEPLFIGHTSEFPYCVWQPTPPLCRFNSSIGCGADCERLVSALKARHHCFASARRMVSCRQHCSFVLAALHKLYEVERATSRTELLLQARLHDMKTLLYAQDRLALEAVTLQWRH
jgi:hypothetical protein